MRLQTAKGYVEGQYYKGANFEVVWWKLNHSKLTKAKLEAAILENEFTLMDAAPVEEGNAHLETTSTPVLHSLDLWIEDMRSGELETGEWVVNGKSILIALQDSPSTLNVRSGPVKLAFEDQLDGGWKRYFARISGSELLRPFQLHRRLFSFLLSIPSPPKRQQSDANVTASEVPSPVSPHKTQTKRSARADPEEVSSLKEILAARTGYQEFRDNPGKRLSNKDRVVFWKFASDFSSEFHKSSEALASSVKKASIESALGMGTTALAEAEKMMRILHKYEESGENRAQDVVTRSSSDTHEGRAFSDLLASWERSNSS
ncbi:hypothetical protein C8R44DRAFT_743998 [Mycena epipterygia]|nr:hypothetical protein C8R44DRAFT_743998 [Mycena epipterygia]